MATWIKIETGELVNLDRVAEISLIAVDKDRYIVEATFPGVSAFSAEEESYHRLRLHAGSREQCKEAMDKLDELLKPVEIP